MGSCLSKKNGSPSSSSSKSSPPVAAASAVSPPPHTEETEPSSLNTNQKHKLEADRKIKLNKEIKKHDQAKNEEEEGKMKKEVFIIKHRKSNDERDRNSKFPQVAEEQNLPLQGDGVASSISEAANKIASQSSTPSGVRTSSCTKEEVDAILIQCGRLSRSSSGKAASSSAASGERGRKYSGSKRSYDFDHGENDNVSADDGQKKPHEMCKDEERTHQLRQRSRQSPRKNSSSSSSQGRRRTPSREREQNQRSSSRERRVSRSPGRRSSENTAPAIANSATENVGNSNNHSHNRPAKMVSVPATVSSLVMDKCNGGEFGATTGGIKRITVKRNVGEGGIVGSRGASSSRSQSPARANSNGKANHESQQLQAQPSLSRSSSRKAEQSPHRRNPLCEIDPNSLAYPQTTNNRQNRNKKELNGEANQKSNVDKTDGNKLIVQGTHRRTNSRGALDKVGEEGNQMPQTLTRTRSSRRSRDLDINPEDLLNTNKSYTSLLLEDIQNFHEKNSTPSFSLPACVTKACSILEAVADLNSTTSSNLSNAAFSEERRSPPIYQSSRSDFNFHLGGKRMTNNKEPFVESEVAVKDDVMEPSFHKYVTVRRGGGALGGGEDMEDQESSGSNSFAASSQQRWGFSSSSWEPHSADSTDCWTSKSNATMEIQKSTVILKGELMAEAARDMEESRRKFNGMRRDCDHEHSTGIGRRRLVADKGLASIVPPVVAATAST